MDREYRTTASAPRVQRATGRAQSSGGVVITGHAARYYDGTPGTEFVLWPGVVERIAVGAFNRAVREGDNAAALFNHNSDIILGRVSANTLRLFSRARLEKRCPRGRSLALRSRFD